MKASIHFKKEVASRAEAARNGGGLAALRELLRREERA